MPCSVPFWYVREQARSVERSRALLWEGPKKTPRRVATDTAVSVPVEQYTCSHVEEEVVIFFFLDSRRAGPAWKPKHTCVCPEVVCLESTQRICVRDLLGYCTCNCDWFDTLEELWFWARDLSFKTVDLTCSDIRTVIFLINQEVTGRVFVVSG